MVFCYLFWCHSVLNNIRRQFRCGSLLPVSVSVGFDRSNPIVLFWFSVSYFCVCFGDVSPYVCTYYFQFGLGCGVATFWERAAHSVDHMFFSILTICNFSYFPCVFVFFVNDIDFGSNCPSSWSLLTFYLLTLIASSDHWHSVNDI